MLTKNISKKSFFIFLGAYFGLRAFSYFFSPSTPLYFANPVNWIVSTGILLAVIYFLLKKDSRGWLIIATEIILGGGGNFLEIKGISLRTCLLFFSILIYLFQVIKDKRYKIIYKENAVIIYLLSSIMAVVVVSTFHGIYYGHATSQIISDIIPYFFFLYYFPTKQLLASEKFRNTSFNLLIAAIVGNFIFTYFTLAGFSSGIFALQDSYYHWFRDIAGGKITGYDTGFFRILLNEQLLLVPLFLLLFSKLIHNQKNQNLILKISSLALLAILTINITRIYLIALAVGILFIFSLKNWKRWLVYSAGAFAFFIITFSLTHLATTKGKSFGWEYLGLRLQSITMPQTEDSSLSRLLLLPKIIEKIMIHPLLGNGLGETITVYSPVFKANITTPHFDWGYLEIIAEMGIIGLAAWLSVISYLFSKIKNKDLLVSMIGLMIINITSPALFHVLGILWISILLCRANPAEK